MRDRESFLIAEHLEHSSGEGVLFENAPGQFLLWVRNVARYLVRDGSEILVDPAPGCEELVLLFRRPPPAHVRLRCSFGAQEFGAF